jgi:hypothetical protein
MNKHYIGFAHTFEIACKNINLDIAGDGSQPIRVDLRRLALIPGNHEAYTRIALHESPDRESSSPIPAKHPGIASKIPV